MSVRMHLALRASLQARQGTRVELIAMDNTRCLHLIHCRDSDRVSDELGEGRACCPQSEEDLGRGPGKHRPYVNPAFNPTPNPALLQP